VNNLRGSIYKKLFSLPPFWVGSGGAFQYIINLGLVYDESNGNKFVPTYKNQAGTHKELQNFFDENTKEEPPRITAFKGQSIVLRVEFTTEEVLSKVTVEVVSTETLVNGDDQKDLVNYIEVARIVEKGVGEDVYPAIEQKLISDVFVKKPSNQKKATDGNLDPGDLDPKFIRANIVKGGVDDEIGGYAIETIGLCYPMDFIKDLKITHKDPEDTKNGKKAVLKKLEMVLVRQPLQMGMQSNSNNFELGFELTGEPSEVFQTVELEFEN